MLRALLFVFLLSLLPQSATANQHGWKTNILSDTFGYGPATASHYSWPDLIQACPRRDCIQKWSFMGPTSTVTRRHTPGHTAS